MFECEPVSKFRFVLTGYTSKTFLFWIISVLGLQGFFEIRFLVHSRSVNYFDV